jgi:electron transfer flavoprotein beta subunit
MSLRVAVCVAAVPNPDKVKWDRFRQLLDLQDAEFVLNPPDRGALELAAQFSKASGSTSDAYSAGAGATNALREAAVFGAGRLIAVDDASLANADAAEIASVLAAAIAKDGGADLVMCGAATTAFASGAVPGFLSVLLNAGLRADVVGIEPNDNGVTITSICGPMLERTFTAVPLVVSAAAYGIETRAVSPILLVRASRKPVDVLSASDLSEARAALSAAPTTTGAADGPLESSRKRRLNEVVDGADPAARAITLASALRERQLV